MNEDFFAGFDNSYVFFDDENDLIISFHDNGIAEVSADEDVVAAKWRYNKGKNILELLISELGFKILYKLSIKKDDKENEQIFLSGKFVVKYEDEDKPNKKGDTVVVRSVNTLSPDEANNSTKLENIVVTAIFLGLFLVLLLLVSFIPAVEKAGLLYASAFILTIQILLIKKIKGFVSKRMSKYEEKINKMFYN